MMALGCCVGAILVRYLLPLYMLPTFNCSFIIWYWLAACSLSQATMPFAWRSLEEACRRLVTLGRSVTASASHRVSEAIHFLNSGRKQGGRVGAVGQRGSPEEMWSPGTGGTRHLPGRGGRLAPCLAQEFEHAPAALPQSHLLHQSLAKGFTGAAVSLITEITSFCFVLELVLGWAPAPQQGCRDTVSCRAGVCKGWM